MSIEQVEKNKCCGCASCINICPQKCIKYIEDEEGFLYPKIDVSKCIKCNLCEKVCPLKTENIKKDEQPDTYIGFANSESDKAKGSSGGIFGIIAQYIIENNGCVYGAAFNSKLELKHIKITKKNELFKILKSKYIQSDISECYKEIVEELKKNKKVLFCGTPCQVAALRNMMIPNELKENLILIDFICHGVPSPGVWKSYIKYLENNLHDKIEIVDFRDKTKGWHDYSFLVKTKDKKITESHELNAYMKSFLSDKNIRPSFYNCFIKTNGYLSDITLGDAWKIEKEKAEWADDKGSSVIIARTRKGRELIDAISDRITIAKSNYEMWGKYNPSLVECTKFNNNRIDFFNKFKDLSYLEFWKENNKIPLKHKMKYSLKRCLKVLKLDKAIRHLKN